MPGKGEIALKGDSSTAPGAALRLQPFTCAVLGGSAVPGGSAWLGGEQVELAGVIESSHPFRRVESHVTHQDLQYWPTHLGTKVYC